MMVDDDPVDGVLRIVPPPKPTHEPVRRPARVAQLLVLAHQIREAIEEGHCANASAAAAAWGLSRNRMSQVLALTYLAPDIQLEVLGMEAIDGVEPAITEKWLFEKVARRLSWEEQRSVWRRATAGASSASGERSVGEPSELPSSG